MSYSATLFSKDGVSVTVSEAAGVVALTTSVDATLGGGSVAGVLGVKGSISAQVSAQQLIDLGLKLAADKYPAASVVISSVQAVIDAEIAKA